MDIHAIDCDIFISSDHNILDAADHTSLNQVGAFRFYADIDIRGGYLEEPVIDEIYGVQVCIAAECVVVVSSEPGYLLFVHAAVCK